MILALLLAAFSAAAPMRVANPKAPGAPALLRAVRLELPVLGIFRPSTAQVLNHFVMGDLGVKGHQMALPPGHDPSDVGGYSLLMEKSGETTVLRSGSLEAPLTPPVLRSINRYFGLRPEEETASQRIKRRLLDLADALSRL